jgi:hypothetical protein
VSELVTDAVRVGPADSLRLTVTRTADVVRVDVETVDSEWESHLHERARRVLAGICDRWGLGPCAAGSVGWFEVAAAAGVDGEGEAGSS